MASPTHSAPARPLLSIALIGVGVIGSYLALLLARIPGIERLLIVDPDRYDAGNLRVLPVAPEDVGHSKALVQAKKIGRLAPAIRVEPITLPVELLPLGKLRVDLIVACLDSLLARVETSRRAWALGVPLLDAGVMADESLIRVTSFHPASGNACYQCGLSDDAYSRLGKTYGCVGQPEVSPTGAPAALGALAAAHTAIEIEKLRSGAGVAGRELVFCGTSGEAFQTRLTLNPACRSGHRILDFDDRAEPPRDLTLGGLFALGESPRLGVFGRRFAGQHVCADCGQTHRIPLFLPDSASATPFPCPDCGSATRPVGFTMRDVATPDLFTSGELARPAAEFGVEPHDVVLLGGDGAKALELTPP